jgi:hypothetical protein
VTHTRSQHAPPDRHTRASLHDRARFASLRSVRSFMGHKPRNRPQFLWSRAGFHTVDGGYARFRNIIS